MNATAEIDKAGRLVVPKVMRDSLHLVPGTRVTFRKEGNSVIIEPERRGGTFSYEDGVLVYSLGSPLPADHTEWLQDAREERADQLYEAGRHR